MSRKILCLLLSVASLGMFSSCKDEDGNGGGPTDLSQQIVGVYKGDMRVEVPLLSYDRTSLQKIYLTSSGENLAKLELRDFSFGLPGEEIPVGDIVVEDINLKATGDAENATITLEPKTVTVTLSPEIGSAQVAINGTVVAGKLSLTINVSEALAVDRVNVTFSGDKMASDNESTEALMTTMTFDDEIVVGQPVIDGTNVLFHVADTAKAEHLAALAWASAFISTLDLPAPLHTLFHSDTPWHPLMACALFIVPGVPLINFVSDMLDSYVQIGITRAVNTLLIVVAMAFGIALAIHVCGIDNFVKDLSMTPHHTYLEFAVAAAISAVGFSMIFNIPRRLLWVVAVGGIIAVCTRNFVNLGPSNHNIGLDCGPVIGSLVGSALISIIVTRAVHWFHTPHHCLSIPSVIPMIPGVLMYRALFAFIDMSGVVGEVTIAMNNAIQASLIILCIAVGVAIPNIFARRWIAPKRQKQLKRLIEERRQRGKFVDLTYID